MASEELAYVSYHEKNTIIDYTMLLVSFSSTAQSIEMMNKMLNCSRIVGQRILRYTTSFYAFSTRVIPNDGKTLSDFLVIVPSSLDS